MRTSQPGHSVGLLQSGRLQRAQQPEEAVVLGRGQAHRAAPLELRLARRGGRRFGHRHLFPLSGRPGDPDLVAVHVDDSGQLAPPTLAAGIVGVLLVDQPGEQRRPEIEVGLLPDALRAHRVAHPLVRVDRRGVRALAGLEVRDHPLVNELVAGQIRGCVVEERLGLQQQCLARSRGRLQLVEPVRQLQPRLGEHRVVDGVLRLEVRVQGGRAHADPVRHLAKGERG